MTYVAMYAGESMYVVVCMRVDMYALRRMPQNPMNLHIRLQSRLGWFS